MKWIAVNEPKQPLEGKDYVVSRGRKHLLDIAIKKNNIWYKYDANSGIRGENINDSVDAVTVVTATQKLTKTFPWFAASVSDIRMLRIEDNNDLHPAIEAVLADD